MGEEVIQGPRWRSALLLILSALFAGGAGWMLLSGDTDWRAYLGVGLFGVGVVVFAIQLVSPPRLVLGYRDFTIISLGRTTQVAWADVERFHLWKPPRGRRMVAWTYKPGRGKPGVIGAMNRAIGVDGILPPTLGGSENLLATVDRHFRMRRTDGYAGFR